MKTRISNVKFAVENEFFKSSVERANEKGEEIKRTKRQASKFRNQKGIAYRYSKSLPKQKKVGNGNGET